MRNNAALLATCFPSASLPLVSSHHQRQGTAAVQASCWLVSALKSFAFRILFAGPVQPQPSIHLSNNYILRNWLQISQANSFRSYSVQGSTNFAILVNSDLPISLDTTGISDTTKPKPWSAVDVMLKGDSIPFTSAEARNENWAHVLLPKQNL